MKNYYFISDAHLGCRAFEHRRTQERRLVNFLDAIKDKAEAVFMLGDIFDFWFEYRDVVPKGNFRLFSTLYDDHFFDYMVAGSKGTKMPRGDKQQIMAYPVVLPLAAQLKGFNAVAQPILSKIETSNQENKRLASMRDALLPKLMSGEIDVSSITA